MTGELLTACLLAALAGWVAGSGSYGGSTVLLRMPAGRLPDPGAGHAPAGARADPGRPQRRVRVAVGLAAVAGWMVVGGWLGVGLAVAVILVVPKVIGRLETAQERSDRLEILRRGPMVADLLAAALSAGVPLELALGSVSRAVGGPTAAALDRVWRRLRLGDPPEVAWADVSSLPGLDGIASTVARSLRTGAPLAMLLEDQASDLRARAAVEALTHVRASAVRAVLPLGLCLLPAFGLLGIVPVVAGLLTGL